MEFWLNWMSRRCTPSYKQHAPSVGIFMWKKIGRAPSIHCLDAGAAGLLFEKKPHLSPLLLGGFTRLFISILIIFKPEMEYGLKAELEMFCESRCVDYCASNTK